MVTIHSAISGSGQTELWELRQTMVAMHSFNNFRSIYIEQLWMGLNQVVILDQIHYLRNKVKLEVWNSSKHGDVWHDNI